MTESFLSKKTKIMMIRDDDDYDYDDDEFGSKLEIRNSNIRNNVQNSNFQMTPSKIL